MEVAETGAPRFCLVRLKRKEYQGVHMHHNGGEAFGLIVSYLVTEVFHYREIGSSGEKFPIGDRIEEIMKFFGWRAGGGYVQEPVAPPCLAATLSNASNAAGPIFPPSLSDDPTGWNFPTI